MNDRHTRIMLKAAGQVIRRKLQSAPKEERHEHTHVDPQITLEMQPVADAISALAEAITAQVKSIEKLIRVLSEQKPPSVHVEPRFDVPKVPVEVTVEAPQVRVDAPQVTVEPTIEVPEIKLPERKKRSLKIKHGDGTTSTITEE